MKTYELFNIRKEQVNAKIDSSRHPSDGPRFKALAKRRRKLKTWVNLRLCLAGACVHLR